MFIKKRGLMKKTIALSLLICTLSSNTTFCMLKHVLRTRKQARHTRTYCTNKSYFKMQPQHIFNMPSASDQYKIRLLEDLYDRNNNTISVLAQQITELENDIAKLRRQNDLAISHVYHEEPLDMKTLTSLEGELQLRADSWK